jgi:predicted ATPase
MTAAAPPKLTIPIVGGTKQVEVEAGRTIFIVGRNGTGKSALVHQMLSMLGEKVIYLPGSRPNFFDNESLSMTPASRRTLSSNLKAWDSSPDTRWHSLSGTSRNEKAIHDLLSAEMQFNVDAANDIKRDGATSAAISRLQSNTSPLDRVNTLLSQANLPVSTKVDAGELKATRDGNVYSIAKTSDGERAALVFTAEVVAAPDGTIFLVDEPELHLHPAIVVPLLIALIAEKPKCHFIISTHELELPINSKSPKIILVRGCTWNSNNVASWDVDILENSENIPESLRVDVLGSRRKILYIEGTSASLDQPLYALLFPSVSIRPRDNCREVARATAGLRDIESQHRVSAYGLVDNDGIGVEKIAQWETQGIYALPVFSVESFYYAAETLKAVADQQSATLGMAADTLLLEAKTAGLASLKKANLEHLAARLAERQMYDQILPALPDREAMIGGNALPISIQIDSPYPGELQKLKDLIAANDLDGIVARYPVRETSVLTQIAKGLRFTGREDYEKAALTRIHENNTLRAALKAKLGKLASQLEEPVLATVIDVTNKAGLAVPQGA